MQYALAIGPLDRKQVESLSGAALRAGVALERHISLKSVRREAVDMRRACGLATAASVAEVARWVRSRDGWFNVAVVALVPRAEDRIYRAAFADGADDAVVLGDAAALERRLANLDSPDASARPPAEKGVALVAASSVAERQHLGRILRQAGFDVAFACEARELVQASGDAPTLVVATATFPPLGGEAAVRTVRTATQQPNLPSIVLGAEPRDQRNSEPCDTRGALLFFADEVLRRGAGVDQRASRRFHYATLCAYREPAADGFDGYAHGLTHDASREGLFVRTLDPPVAGTYLWLELHTPEGRLVHLRGHVVWQRHPAQLGPTAPPGFGFRIDADETPPGDLAAYHRGYDLFDVRRAN